MDVVFRRPVPIAQQYGINDESGLSVTEKQIVDRLPDQVAPSEDDKDRYRSMASLMYAMVRCSQATKFPRFEKE